MAQSPGLRFFSYEEIRRIADDYASRHCLGNEVPVDIDRLVDNIL
jgi:hypothetical protein